MKPPEYVLWSVGSKPLNFGTDQGAVRHGNGGHSVTFDPGPPSVSRLAVHSATATDSGRYTCQPSSGLSATTNVHVALGDYETIVVTMFFITKLAMLTSTPKTYINTDFGFD